MADSKLSGLTTASTLVSTDLMYVVKPATSPYDHKVTIANLFGGIPVSVVLNNKLVLSGTTQTLTSAGAINTTALITKITSPDGPGTLTIADGVEGQVKVVVMISNTGGHNLTISSNIGHSSIVFNSAGDTANLIFLSGNWYFLGGTASVA